jgi:CO dehydrogenase maturation factor
MNITLLVTGKSREAATGCYCPENVLLRRLLKHLVVERDEVVVLDMEAGIEHLTRGTTESMDAFIVVVEPGQRSIQTAHTVKRMAEQLGVREVLVVANKTRSASDLEKIRGELGQGMRLIGSLSFNQATIQADMDARPPYEDNKILIEEIRAVKESLGKRIA